MVLFCFSKEKLGEDERDKGGRHAKLLSPYVNLDESFDISLCEATCREPHMCCASILCFCPMQVYMRHRILNHINPGSGWSNYSCCQGMYGSWYCLQPGSMGESTCPVPCMFLEACVCPGPAVSTSSIMIRKRFSLGLDKDDVRLIRCGNCLFISEQCLRCISKFTDKNADESVASIVSCISDIIFLSVSGCMTAQVYREIEKREMSSPTKQSMSRSWFHINIFKMWWTQCRSRQNWTFFWSDQTKNEEYQCISSWLHPLPNCVILYRNISHAVNEKFQS